eukprot:SM000013S26477  [mRNA]  locus=s13:636106:642291:+ [translate_table: standard]
MGAAESSSFYDGLQRRMDTFVGPSPVPLDDPFWSELLAFPYPLSRLRAVDLDERTKEAALSLAAHNQETRHFPKVLLRVVHSLQGEPSSNQKVLKAVNTLIFARTFTKHMLEASGAATLAERLALDLTSSEAEALGLHPGQQDVAVLVMQSLMAYIGSQDVNLTMYRIDYLCERLSANTYVLHLESVNLLLVLLSSQLHLPPGEAPGNWDAFLDAAMAQDALAGPLVRKLLLAYMARLPMPITRVFPSQPAEQQGYLRTVGSAAATVFLLPYYTYTYFMSPNQAAAKSPLAENCLLLLLVLVHHGKPMPLKPQGNENGEQNGTYLDEVGTGRPQYYPNPFKQELQAARDKEFSMGGSVADTQEKELGATRVSYAALFDKLGACLLDDRSTLLLYSLLHGNVAFLEYVLVRTDLDTLLMPLLEMLYNASRRTPNQIYMLLISLLILSQDASFNANVHKLILPAVPWYKERLLPRISLGSLMVVILIRTVKYNLSKLRPTELHIYTDFLRIVLEIINAILTYALPRNPEVVYALLHRQELFQPFRNHPRFYELLENIYTVLDFFNVRMDDTRLAGEWSVERVLEVVVANTRSWRGEGMKMFTELRFTYEEELHPEEFFVPYVWSLVVAHSGIPWNSELITLFSTKPAAELEDIFDNDAFDTGSELPTPREEV